MPPLHQVHSRYARLSPEAIDFTLEHVRDADEVLFGSELLDARDMVRIARSVMETERSFEQDPAGFIEIDGAPRSDWTLACVADALAQASAMLQERGSRSGAERARADQRSVLRRIVDSPVRSPVVGYAAVLSALRYDLPPASATELLALQHLALAEALRSETQTNPLSIVCDIVDSLLNLEQESAAMCVLLGVLRFDPTDAWVHNRVALSLERRLPGIAHAAATRALLLLPRDDKTNLRPQLRRVIEETRSPAAAEPPRGLARALLAELQAPPGKRSRGSLRALCTQLVPELSDLPEKELEALPDSAALAQLRRDLQTLPRPKPELAARLEASALRARGVAQPTAVNGAIARQGKVGRNDLCPCGSGKKWKRCCGAR